MTLEHPDGQGRWRTGTVSLVRETGGCRLYPGVITQGSADLPQDGPIVKLDEFKG